MSYSLRDFSQVEDKNSRFCAIYFLVSRGMW